jgi:hypothetical protein
MEPTALTGPWATLLKCWRPRMGLENDKLIYWAYMTKYTAILPIASDFPSIKHRITVHIFSI